jgi:hypothetical protein
MAKCANFYIKEEEMTDEIGNPSHIAGIVFSNMEQTNSS